jgi:hypothetical protein
MECRITRMDWRWTGGGLKVDSMDYIGTRGGLQEDPWGSVRYSIFRMQWKWKVMRHIIIMEFKIPIWTLGLLTSQPWAQNFERSVEFKLQLQLTPIQWNLCMVLHW